MNYYYLTLKIIQKLTLFQNQKGMGGIPVSKERYKDMMIQIMLS